MILPITLTLAGVAALINIWLMVRVGRVRTSEKVSVGDGGNEKVIRRMRAHANFGESLPIVLILIAIIEMARPESLWLWALGGIYMLGRIAHGFGMDGGSLAKGRTVGTIITLLVMLGLAIWAITIPYMSQPAVEADTIVDPMA